jgi:hypothetical protein
VLLDRGCLGASLTNCFFIDAILLLVDPVDSLGGRIRNVYPEGSLTDRDLFLVN